MAPKKCAKVGKMVGQYRGLIATRNLRDRTIHLPIPYRNLRSIAMHSILLGAPAGKDADSLYSIAATIPVRPLYLPGKDMLTG